MSKNRRQQVPFSGHRPEVGREKAGVREMASEQVPLSLRERAGVRGATSSSAARGRLRRGLSLLEVLISMGVLLIGVLGVAALIPVGRYNVQQATNADRAGALGRAALREIKVRNMLDPIMGVGYDGTRSNRFVSQFGGNPSSVLTYVCDPLVIAQQNYLGGAANVQFFPYEPTGTSATQPNLWVTRVMLAPAAMPWSQANPWKSFSGSNSAAPLAWAKSIFVWPDDVSFNIPADPNYRSQQLFPVNTGNALTAGMYGPAWPIPDTNPRLPANTTISWYDCVGRAGQGSYSWMFTVSPALVDVDRLYKPCPFTTTPPQAWYDGHTQLFEVSAVVFYNRDPLAYSADANYSNSRPPERWVNIPTNLNNNFAGFGWGGGSLTIQVPNANYGPDYLYVKPGEWMAILVQTNQVQQGGPTTAATSTVQPQVLRWYKVVNAGEVLPGTNYRSVSLVGANSPTCRGPTFPTTTACFPRAVRSAPSRAC